MRSYAAIQSSTAIEHVIYGGYIQIFRVIGFVVAAGDARLRDVSTYTDITSPYSPNRLPTLLIFRRISLMMTYSISKSFTIGALFFVLSASSEAFSHSSSHSHRLKSDLLYRKNSLIDLENVNPALLSTKSAQVKTEATAAPKKDKHLVKIDFEKDLSMQLDVAMPYYSLENENAIVDGTTGEYRGIICTVKREAPIGREAGEISFFEFLRAAGLISSAAVILAKPFKKRHHTPAENYSVDVNPAHENWLRAEISSIVGGQSFFDNASDPVFLTM